MQRGTFRAVLLGFILGEALILGLFWFRGDLNFGSSERTVARTTINTVPSQVLSGSYPLKINRIAAVSDPGSGGAIDAFQGSIVMATRRGDFLIYARGGADARFNPISVPTPVNLEGQQRAGAPARIGLQDLQIEPGAIPGTAQFFVSITDADTDGACVRMRVATMVVATDVLTDAAVHDGDGWDYIFTADDCVPSDSGFNHEAGGALDVAATGEVVLTIGPFGFDGTNTIGDVIEPQNPDSVLGKVISIDPETKAYSILSTGHRNSDGLVVGTEGTIWQLEHGPRGGDELNIIRKGTNYGWPYESYGTGYGSFDLAPADQPGLHDSYELPIYSWVPSLGMSALEQMSGSEFPIWDGDLFTSSLKGSRIDRLHLRDGRVVVAEPIPIGDRIRDIAVGTDGAIYLKSDNGPIVYEVVNANADGDSQVAGLSFCASCHQLKESDPENSAGPTLVGVFGRDIASDPNYTYSAALKAVRGEWNDQTLRAYIANPDRFAQGTSMPQLDLKNCEVGQAVSQLQGL